MPLVAGLPVVSIEWFANIRETAKSFWRARPDIRGNLSHPVCILVGNRKHRRLGQVPAGPGLGSSCFFLLPCLCLARRGVSGTRFDAEEAAVGGGSH